MSYDLALYLCPTNGRQFVLGGLGEENCQSVLAADGWLDFHKNALDESFYVTADVVGRGVDTSSLYTPDGLYHGTYYIQYTADKYGAAWAKRLMSVGDVFHRVCNIRTYDWTGRLIKTDVNVGSDLHLNAHHDSITFPSGITVQDILELQWGGAEVYYYANGYGLVGWKNLATGEQSFIASNTATIQPLHPIPTPRPVVAPPAPVTPIPPTPPVTPLGLYTLTTIPALYVNVRAAPIATAADVGDLHMGDVVQRFAPDVNGWTYVEKDALKGWVSLQNGAVVFTPVTAPAPPDWTVNLRVPFVSQIDSTSAASNNDCGISSLLMQIRYWIDWETGITPSLPTVDEAEKYTPLANHPPPLGLTFAEIDALARRYGFSIKYISPLTVDKITQYLDANTPVMVLVDYGVFNPGAKSIPHLCIVKGYNATHVLCADPYMRGNNYAIPRSQLEAAMRTVPGNSGSYQGAVLSV